MPIETDPHCLRKRSMRPMTFTFTLLLACTEKVEEGNVAQDSSSGEELLDTDLVRTATGRSEEDG